MRIRLSLIAVILFCNCLTGFCQVDLFFPLSKEFSWAGIEKQNRDIKTKFIGNLPDELEFFKQSLNASYLEDCLHVLDFDGDGTDDVIFNGFTGNESRYLIVYINTGDSFVKVFTGHQEIYKIVLKNGKVRKLYIRDGGCCCDYIGLNKIYSVDHSSALPEFTLISQMQFLNNSVEKYPDYYFYEPVKFEVLNDRYNIRFSPVVDDTTEVGYCGEIKNGNSLGKVKSGSIGYALSEEIDSTGRVWWFVALCPDSEVYDPVYYEPMYCDEATLSKTYKTGWISSRFVREINE